MMRHKRADCLVIGGGPAGLTAAIYLARFRRKVIVIDKGGSRASLIPNSHNYPGFTDGISGTDFISRMREQAAQFGAVLKSGSVLDLKKRGNIFVARTESEIIKAPMVLLATGIVDGKPSLPSLGEFIYDGKIRFCPICDGYEAMNKRIGILGPWDRIVPKALFLRTYSGDLILLPTDKLNKISGDIHTLKKSGVAIPTGVIEDLIAEGDSLIAVMPDQKFELDILYPALGAHIESDLAVTLGADASVEGCLVTDQRQSTSVPGLYAAGDIVEGLSQISVATSQGAIAATSIHEHLGRNFIKASKTSLVSQILAKLSRKTNS